jgi:hypothetical protein
MRAMVEASDRSLLKFLTQYPQRGLDIQCIASTVREFALLHDASGNAGMGSAVLSNVSVK